MTFYLKYRPQTISSLDLASVRRELGTILTSGRFAHAYLFSGPRGTGKTSAARILAKIVNCERNSPSSRPSVGISSKQASRRTGMRQLTEPCNKCLSCRAITDGNDLDLTEIDAASNRGIDDIRELRERIRLSPARSPYKVYIIDEVHMLTTEAFNALLKTLEEPPAHALFVLCTTEAQKLPKTVISRCTEIRFPKATPAEVVLGLKKAVKGENLKLEEGALEAIAEAVDGSFRDGMKILEQLSLRATGKSARAKKITVSDVSQVLGLSGEDAARKLLVLLAEREVAPVLGLISEVWQRQVSLEQFVREILELLRRLLLSEVGVLEETRVDGLGRSDIRQLLRLFSAAAAELRTSTIPTLPLELACIEWMDSSMSQSKSNDNGGAGLDNPVLSNQKIGTQTPKTQIRREEEQKKAHRKSAVSFSEVQDRWPRVLEQVRPQNHSLEALLKAAKPKKLDAEILVVEVAYPFHKQQLELGRYKAIVEAAVSDVFSAALRLQYILREYPHSEDEERKKHENLSGAVDDKIIQFAEDVFGVKSE